MSRLWTLVISVLQIRWFQLWYFVLKINVSLYWRMWVDSEPYINMLIFVFKNKTFKWKIIQSFYFVTVLFCHNGIFPFFMTISFVSAIWLNFWLMAFLLLNFNKWSLYILNNLFQSIWYILICCNKKSSSTITFLFHTKLSIHYPLVCNAFF